MNEEPQMGSIDMSKAEPQNKPPDFRQSLTNLLNYHSKENGSNTPDCVLAQFLGDCLEAFDAATKWRDNWYGVRLRPGDSRFIEED